MAKSTWASYRASVNSFMIFRDQLKLEKKWPVPQNHIMAFISFLVIEGKSPSTINSRMSALAFVHKVNGWLDPTDSFIIKKLKEGCKRGNPQCDSRLPITPILLRDLVEKLPSMCSSQYEALLFKAAFLLAFVGFLRVGEFTSLKKSGDTSRILAIDDISISEKILHVRIRFSKTDQKGLSSNLKIESSTGCLLCPVKALEEFLLVRSGRQGPLFIHFAGDPLTSFQFRSMLKNGIKLLGLTPDHFSSHSFRIGAATAAALGGASEEEIKRMGRWRSSAYQSYIRPQLLWQSSQIFL